MVSTQGHGPGHGHQLKRRPKLFAGRGRDCQKSCEEGLRNDDGSLQDRDQDIVID